MYHFNKNLNVYIILSLISGSILIVLHFYTTSGFDFSIGQVSFEGKIIEAGSFTMGSPFSEEHRNYHEQQHVVTLTKDYWIGSTEVTVEQWESVMGTFSPGICMNVPSEVPQKDTPVYCVSWCDTVLFLNKLSELHQLEPVYIIPKIIDTTTDTNQCNSEAVYTQWEPLANGYRLPTEAEWEYAARAGFATVYSGSSDHRTVSWGKHNSSNILQPVKTLQSNYWGLYDMSGNVSEWVWDHYDLYLPHKSVDPSGPIEDLDQDGRRIIRGGSILSSVDSLRVANRGLASPGLRSHVIGFRMARTIEKNR